MLKKLSSNKTWFWIWALYHGGVIAAFLISLIFTKGLHFDADFTKMMPSSAESEAARIADRAISQGSGSTVFILASHQDFQTAKKAAETACEELSKHQSKFKSLNLYTDDGTAGEIQEFLGTWRANLLNSETQNLLNSKGGPEKLAQKALAQAYGGFSMTSLETLAEDPFMLDQINLASYLQAVSDSGTALSPKDGVLAVQFQDRWFVMIRGELSPEGARMASKENAVPLIYDVCFPLEKDGVRFAFYGTNFHSYKSSTSAQSEISVISTVSLIAVILILLFVFRSGLPLLGSLFSISASVLIAFCATHLFFGNIHMTALVFGTSLIGSCIDYSLHYFINWKTEKSLDSAEKIRRHLFNGLILSLVSTELCFTLLIFAPFGMLKQMAVFSLTGILSSFLTTGGFFTLFKLPPAEKRTIPFLEKLNFRIPHRKAVSLAVPALIFVTSAVILVVKHQEVKISNNITNLYKMEGRLKDDTVLAYQVLDYSPSSWLIVEGDTVDQVLQTEERLAPQIPDHYICTSRFIPSPSRQKESVKAASKLIPLAPAQYENLGFDADYAEDFAAAVNSASSVLTPESPLPETLQALLNMLWVGEVNGKFYSIILPSKVSDEGFYKKLAADNPGVYYENKIADINGGLNKLTKLIMLMFAAAFVVIAIIMKFFYSWRETLKIVSIPVLSILVITAVFVLAGLKIEFFCITGVILVFGLGLDYVIYRMENKENKTEAFAIALSFLTTAISFGALALSSFVPVHVIGLSIFSGLVTAFVCAIL